MNEKQKLALKEKMYFIERIDLESWQDIRKEITCKGQDMALKFWRASEGEMEVRIFSWER